MMVKRVVSCILFLTLMFTSIVATPIMAHEYTASSSSSTIEPAVVVTDDNIDDIISRYSVPAEVANRLRQKLMNKDGDSTLILGAPSDENISARSTGSYWGTKTTINGYVVKDWVVYETASFTPTVLGGSAAAENALSFVGSIFMYAGSVIAGYVSPFGSAAVSVCEFIFNKKSDTVRATASDWVSVAPAYTCYEMFTYVETPDGDILGCRSARSRLDYITWEAYSYTLHKTDIGQKNYNQYIYSESYSDRFSVAYKHYVTGAQIDQEVSIRIANKTFILE